MALAECSSETVSRRALEAFAESDAGGTVVWLRGEHDASTVTALSLTSARAIDAGPVDATLTTATVGALGTWVAVPATGRVDGE